VYPLFWVFVDLFIGISAGFGVVLGIKNFLWPKILLPLLGLDIVIWPDGTAANEYNPYLLLYILPMLFGLLYYFVYSKKHNWLAKLVIGFSLGMSAGLEFRGFFNQIIPQVISSFKPLIVLEAGQIKTGASLENALFIFTLLSVMYYFFFSFKHTSALSRSVSQSGRWLLMICFGAFFGSTVMARLALLVERLQFLLVDFREALIRVFV
jgi:hypothetical protein